MFFITPARVGPAGAPSQVSVGWKEIYTVVEHSRCIGFKFVFSHALNGNRRLVEKSVPFDAVLFNNRGYKYRHPLADRNVVIAD